MQLELPHYTTMIMSSLQQRQHHNRDVPCRWKEEKSVLVDIWFDESCYRYGLVRCLVRRLRLALVIARFGWEGLSIEGVLWRS